MLHLLTSISSVRLYIPKDLRPFDNRQLMLKSIQVGGKNSLDKTQIWHGSTKIVTIIVAFSFLFLQIFCVQEVQKRFPDGVPLLDPIDDMGIKDPGLKKVIQKVEAFEHRMYSHPLHSDPNLESVYSLCEKKAVVSLQWGKGQP